MSVRFDPTEARSTSGGAMETKRRCRRVASESEAIAFDQALLRGDAPT
jgi:hypothetical protein